MSWAKYHIENLRRGETVQFRPRGSSMKGRVDSGQKVTVGPLLGSPLVGDIVLCTVRGKDYLHIVKAKQGDRFQIGNNRGGINGWIGINSIHGTCTAVED